ncbi:MAG TPA: type II secretion system F family protein [Capillimicrobium sp.]|nr:type II secretion system F family protein [Capillimicrobium sp.]
MSRAVLLSAGAGVTAVLAAWELLGAVAAGAATGLLERILSPLRRAGAFGEAPTTRERRRLATVAALTLLAAGWLVGGPVSAAVLACGGPAVAAALVRARRRRWRARLVAAAPAVARALADALAGGHSIRGAVAEAARGGGIGGPAGRELAAVARSLALGEPTAQALERLRRRASAPAYDTLVAAVLLQQDAGGDLAGLLRELAASLEAAARAARDAHTATTQARFTGTLVAVLPVGGAALAELAQPGSLAALLSSPLTAAMVAAAAVLQVTGLLVIRRLARSPR